MEKLTDWWVLEHNGVVFPRAFALPVVTAWARRLMAMADKPYHIRIRRARASELGRS